jgi:hypothetical protein
LQAKHVKKISDLVIIYVKKGICKTIARDVVKVTSDLRALDSKGMADTMSTTVQSPGPTCTHIVQTCAQGSEIRGARSGDRRHDVT